METNVIICQRYSSNRSRSSFHFIDKRRFSFSLFQGPYFISAFPPLYAYTYLHKRIITFQVARKKETGREKETGGRAEVVFKLSESWTGLIAPRNCPERHRPSHVPLSVLSLPWIPLIRLPECRCFLSFRVSFPRFHNGEKERHR